MGSNSTSKRPGRTSSTLFLLVLLACVTGMPLARAQTTAVARPAKVTPPDTSPLSRFVPKENLVVYLEFSGLDSHEAAWKNTSCYKILNDTTFGEVLGAVSEQLLEKVLSFVPGHRLSGSQIVALVKHTARSGFVVALHADSKARQGYRGTFVLRGGASKEIIAVTSRLMGSLMGASGRRVEKKEGRQLIVVLPADAKTPATDPGAWVWWPEKNDLVIGFMDPSSADSVIAALDGKTPSAVKHEVINELAKPEGQFEPVCFGFAVPGTAAASSSPLTTLLDSVKKDWGADRVDVRWGFESEALVTVARMVSAKPRKGALAAFDGPTFDKKTLLPLPDQINSFVETSVNPRHLVELIKQMAPSSEVKQQIDEIAESIKNEGSLDLEKDVLGHLGPKIVAYRARGGSAMTGDDSPGGALKDGWSPAALFAALQSNLPTLTIVAEVKDSEAFGKALDGVIVALNKELKAQAIEKAVEERKEADKKDQPASGRGGGSRLGGGGGGNQTKTRRPPLQQTPSPRFTATPTAGKAKLFVLLTPPGSPLQFGPKSFRPTIELEGKYLVFAVSPESAKNALASVVRTDWKPSGDLAKALEHVVEKLVFLVVSDVSETLPPVLASFPGTLQAVINTTLALAKGKDGAESGSDRPAAPGTGQAAASPGAMPGRGRGGLAAPGGRGAMAGPSGARGGVGGPAGAPSNSQGTPPGSSAAGSPGDTAIVFNIDAEKLPKASDLKAHLFPSTFTISVTDQEIRMTSREAFPDLGSLVKSLPMLGMLPGAKALIDLTKTPAAGDAQAAAAGAATAQPAAAPAATPKAAPPGGRRGGGGRPR
jgi:hypothetical protein